MLRDPEAASTWVRGMAPGAARDAAVSGLVRELANPQLEPDYPAALSWALSIADPRIRQENVRETLAALRHPLPAWKAEMGSVLENAPGLTPEERKTFFELLPP